MNIQSLVTYVFFATLIAFGGNGNGWVWANSKELLSDEMVPMTIKAGAVDCYDALPDFGYTAKPGFLFIADSNIHDPSLRLKLSLHGSSGFSFELPNTVTCATLRGKLKAVPTKLRANRKVYRQRKETFQQVTFQLVADIQIEIPVQIEGKNAVLKTERAWIEKILAKADPASNPPLPLESSYLIRAYPQACSGHGIHCVGPKKNQLSMGRIRGGVLYSNVEITKKEFESADECNQVRSKLLDGFRATDPLNKGTVMTVNRKIESFYRILMTGQDEFICLETQMDTETIMMDNDHTLIGVETFPVQTVDLKNCM